MAEERAVVPWSTRRVQVEEWMLRRERDGIPFRRMAAELGIPVATLYFWAKRLRREREGRDARGRVLGATPGFVEVKAPVHSVDAARGGGIELVLASGLRIRVERDFEETTLRRLLVALGA